MKKKWMKTLAAFLALCIGVSSINPIVLAKGNDANANNEVAVTTDALESTWDSITMTDVQYANGCRITFALKDHWDGGYNAEVILENTGDQAIQNWILGMDWNGEMTSVWNAELSQRTENGYIFKNVGWNQDIETGKSVTFGICAQEDFPGFPQKYQLMGDYVFAGEEEYAVDFRIHSTWETGFTAEMFLTNQLTETTIEDWILEFDFEGTIHEIWNGVIISHEGTHYVVQNNGHNANIAPGQTISFGFNGDGSHAEPVNFSLQSMKDNAAEEKSIAVFIDDPLLEWVGASGFYKTTGCYLSLSGHLAEAEKVKTFYYQVLDEEGQIVLTDDLSATARWKLDNIPLQVGKNIIVIFASDEDGNTVSAVTTVLREEKKGLVLWIDKSAFEKAGVSEEYKTTETFVRLKGTLGNPEDAETLYLERLDLQGDVIESKSITIATEWETDEIELNVGYNVLEVVARSKSGMETRERLVIVRRE